MIGAEVCYFKRRSLRPAAGPWRRSPRRS